MGAQSVAVLQHSETDGLHLASLMWTVGGVVGVMLAGCDAAAIAGKDYAELAVMRTYSQLRYQTDFQRLLERIIAHAPTDMSRLQLHLD